MDKQKFQRRLSLTNRRYHDLLEELAQQERPAGPGSRPREQPRRSRLDYPVRDIPLCVEHPVGGQSCFLVDGRNLARGGMSVLHSGFVHTGSACRIMLRMPDGRSMVVDGEIRHCRLLDGCHEIGIRFDEEIDPGTIAGVVSTERLGQFVSGPGIESMTGSLLLAEQSTPDRVLLDHHLSGLGLDVHSVATSAAMLDAMQRSLFDIVLASWTAGTIDFLRPFKALRDLHCAVPLIVMAGDLTAESLATAEAAGSSAVLGKPVHLEHLVTVLLAHLDSVPAPSVIYSTRAGERGLAPLLCQYVEHLRHAADRLGAGHERRDWVSLRKLCDEIRGSAIAYGFPEITAAAVATIRDMHTSHTDEALGASIARLQCMCRAARLRGCIAGGLGTARNR